jgi:hypothetical protein
MKATSIPFKNSKTSKVVFILSILSSGFWCFGQFLNVYRFTLVGVLYEILWLPALAILCLLPLFSLLFLVKEKGTNKSFYFYSILISVATILSMVFVK